MLLKKQRDAPQHVPPEIVFAKLTGLVNPHVDAMMMAPIITAMVIGVIDDADGCRFNHDDVAVVGVIVGAAMDHDFVLDAAGHEHRHGEDGEKEQRLHMLMEVSELEPLVVVHSDNNQWVLRSIGRIIP